MRPRTPALDVANGAAGPTSPPATPTTASPSVNRKLASNGRPPSKGKAHRLKNQQPNIKPIGGTQFSYTPGPEEISPRSSDSSDGESESSSTSPPQSPLSDIPEFHSRQDPIQIPRPPITSIQIEQATFEIELLSDCSLDSDDGRLNVLRPDAFEYADSDRSRSRSRPPPEMDPTVMTGVENLNPFDDGSEEEEDDEMGHDEEFNRQLRSNREKRRVRRMKSGSISKRTVSERGSDSDREDVLPYYEGNETGPNLRRMRRKVGDRSSIQLSGALPERIEELKEPNSDDEIILEDAEFFARELPYWTLMDVDSE